jgi:putative transcriptional regulator
MAKIITNNIRKLRFAHQEMTQQKLAEAVSASRQKIVAMKKENISSIRSGFQNCQSI